MPKITRKRVSVFESPLVRFVSILLVVAATIVGGSIYLGVSGEGAIDVNDKIASTNQDGFVNRVNQNSNINDVNGGLKPSSLSPDAQTAPEPVPIQTPVVEGTSTEATTTNDVLVPDAASDASTVPSEGI